MDRMIGRTRLQDGVVRTNCNKRDVALVAVREHHTIRNALRWIVIARAIPRGDCVARIIAGNERRILARLLPGKTVGAFLESRIANLVVGSAVRAIREIKPREVRIAER